jgi:hypothetical protein
VAVWRLCGSSAGFASVCPCVHVLYMCCTCAAPSQTKVIPNNENPTWNEEFDFVVDNAVRTAAGTCTAYYHTVLLRHRTAVPHCCDPWSDSRGIVYRYMLQQAPCSARNHSVPPAQQSLRTGSASRGHTATALTRLCAWCQSPHVPPALLPSHLTQAEQGLSLVLKDDDLLGASTEGVAVVPLQGAGGCAQERLRDL